MGALANETMIKLLVITSLIFFYISGFCQYPFIIHARSTTLKGKEMYFNIFNNTDITALQIDSAVFKDGYLQIKGEMHQQSSFANFTVKDKKKYISADFIVQLGNNNVNLELVEGVEQPLKLISDAKDNLISDEISNLYYQGIKAWKLDSTEQPTSEMITALLDQQRSYLERYPNDFGSVLILYRLGRSDFSSEFAQRILKTLKTFSDSIKNVTLAKELYNEKTALIQHYQSSRIGNSVLKFSVKDVNNKLFKIDELKGYNYVIAFSATWCGPCQKQLPKLKALYERYKGKGLKVVYFNIDDDVVRWRNHVRKNKLNWINVSERLKPIESKIEKLFGVYAIPVYFLVNKKGIIIYNSSEIDRELDQLETYIKKMIK